ncbi:hypothetical protein ACWIUD_04120 [Helicobacter sp. 23-1044]
MAIHTLDSVIFACDSVKFLCKILRFSCESQNLAQNFCHFEGAKRAKNLKNRRISGRISH